MMIMENSMKDTTGLRSDTSGEIMIESTIIVLMTTFILIFLVSLGFLFAHEQ